MLRSPPEYAEDCVPGAVNQPALSAAERAEVGALHKESPFEARRRGAGMVASNLSLYLKTHWAGGRRRGGRSCIAGEAARAAARSWKCCSGSDGRRGNSPAATSAIAAK